MTRVRLDVAMVERGLSRSREQAQRLVMAGRVRVNGQPGAKPGRGIGPDDAIEVEVPEKFAGRAWMWAPQRAGLPTACSSGARDASLRWMWGAASSTGALPPTRG